MDPIWTLTEPGKLSLSGTRFAVVMKEPGDYRVWFDGKQVTCSGSYSVLSRAKQVVLDLVAEALEMGIKP